MIKSPYTYRRITFIENNLALGILALAVIIVDRMVKFYITELLEVGEVVPVIGSFFQITRLNNMGAAFGMLQGWSWFFIIAAVAVLGIIMISYDRIIQNRLLVFATAFILGGTVGNMLDRVFFGHVIDYINIAFWPSFNLADMSLTVGAVLLVIYFVTNENKKDEHIDFARY